jgi:hypothetical protein
VSSVVVPRARPCGDTELSVGGVVRWPEGELIAAAFKDRVTRAKNKARAPEHMLIMIRQAEACTTRYFSLVGEICGSPIRSNGRRKLASRSREPDVG